MRSVSRVAGPVTSITTIAAGFGVAAACTAGVTGPKSKMVFEVRSVLPQPANNKEQAIATAAGRWKE